VVGAWSGHAQRADSYLGSCSDLPPVDSFFFHNPIDLGFSPLEPSAPKVAIQPFSWPAFVALTPASIHHGQAISTFFWRQDGA